VKNLSEQARNLSVKIVSPGPTTVLLPVGESSKLLGGDQWDVFRFRLLEQDKAKLNAVEVHIELWGIPNAPVLAKVLKVSLVSPSL